MKQIVVSIAALLLLSTAAMAQDNQGQRPDRQRMDRTEMIKQRTDETVKKYLEQFNLVSSFSVDEKSNQTTIYIVEKVAEENEDESLS